MFVIQTEAFFSSTLEADNNREMAKESNSSVVLLRAAIDPQMTALGRLSKGNRFHQSLKFLLLRVCLPVGLDEITYS